MRSHLVILSASVLSLFLAWSPLDAQGSGEGKTYMTQRGKLLLQEDFQKPLGPEWLKGKGKWDIVDGALRGVELKEDMHGAVRRHALSFHNAVIQYQFKLDGTRQTTLSINAAKGHVCRVVIRPDFFAVQKDKSKKDNDKAVVLDSRTVPIQTGEWHTLVVEIYGKEMLASLDGKLTVFGANEGIDVPKANIGLTVAGSSASFKNLRVWDAQSNPGWEAIRAKLKTAK